MMKNKKKPRKKNKSERIETRKNMENERERTKRYVEALPLNHQAHSCKQLGENKIYTKRSKIRVKTK